ncbi:hypothetical protein DICPUDRAFT_74364 [Dictyostelium purpureum]|uniref:Uncharacterized protein n=1 Tax=Dictyostelium purpureum TaxID=5786 RepID=F0Z7I6_DICPU|nr:uncharacterized protein DICPUDRAFT_74364 [Dictyostelium purpureum]EGC40066.1 hypothetical protein DICPUDRAFT_74364 [Dictyostelium purpureum]|eukprot:XP_003283415.1 hypothetical protein DICPUDRAFT_74364 [Dictyostelium purpureum]
MNSLYEIPTDKNSCCYSEKSEILEEPSTLPEILGEHTNLNLKDYKKIVKTCNSYFFRRDLLLYYVFFYIIWVVMLIVLLVILDSKFLPLILGLPLFLLIVLHIFLLIRLKKYLENIIKKLNSKFLDKGIKVETKSYFVGYGKKRRGVTRIIIAYNENNVNKQQDYTDIKNGSREIELSTYQQENTQFNYSYTPAISLEKKYDPINNK